MEFLYSSILPFDYNSRLKIRRNEDSLEIWRGYRIIIAKMQIKIPTYEA